MAPLRFRYVDNFHLQATIGSARMTLWINRRRTSSEWKMIFAQIMI